MENKFLLERLALFFVAYLPFQIALNPLPSVDLASVRIFILVFFFLWLTHGLISKRLIIPFENTSFFIYAFLFFSVFSIFFAQNFIWGAKKILFLLGIAFIYVVFHDLFEKEERQEKILKWLVFGSFATAIVGIIQFLLQFILGLEKTYTFWAKYIAPIFLGKNFSESVLTYPSWLVNISGETIFRAISVFPDPHMFSFYMGMTFPLALSLFFRKKNLFFLIASFIIIIADFLSFSRGGYMGIFAGTSVMMILYFSIKGSLHSKKVLRGVFYAIPVLLALFIFTPLGSRFLASFDLSDGSNSERLRLWKEASAITMQHPFGVGIGNLPLEILPTASYRDPIYAHDLYLDISSETGLIALASFVLILFSAIFAFYKKSKNDILYLGPFLSLIIFSVHSIVETPLYSVHILSLFFILLALSSTKIKNFSIK